MRIAAHVRHATGAAGEVLVLDTRAGSWYVLNATGASFWEHWSRGRDLPQSLAAVAARHPEVAPTRVRADGEALLEHLAGLGLVDPVGTDPPTPATSAAASDPPAAPASSRPAARVGSRGSGARHHRLLVVVAPVALLVAVLLVRLPFRWTHLIVGATRARPWCRYGETVSGAEELMAAACRAARRFPGRAACMEISLAAVLLAAGRRHRLDWCLGALTDPYRFHAWVECAGRRWDPGFDPNVGEPHADDRVGVLRV